VVLIACNVGACAGMEADTRDSAEIIEDKLLARQGCAGNQRA
jgi:hypothetical protein